MHFHFHQASKSFVFILKLGKCYDKRDTSIWFTREKCIRIAADKIKSLKVVASSGNLISTAKHVYISLLENTENTRLSRGGFTSLRYYRLHICRANIKSQNDYNNLRTYVCIHWPNNICSRHLSHIFFTYKLKQMTAKFFLNLIYDRKRNQSEC